MVKYSSRSPRRTYTSRLAVQVALTSSLCEIYDRPVRRTIRHFAIHVTRWHNTLLAGLSNSQSKENSAITPPRATSTRRCAPNRPRQFPHLGYSASQPHTRVHSTPPSIRARHNCHCHGLAASLGRPSPRSPQFPHLLPLPLQDTPKLGVVNLKPLECSGLRGGRSGQTQVNTRAIIGENGVYGTSIKR